MSAAPSGQAHLKAQMAFCPAPACCLPVWSRGSWGPGQSAQAWNALLHTPAPGLVSAPSGNKYPPEGGLSSCCGPVTSRLSDPPEVSTKPTWDFPLQAALQASES
jgi:hypothetical protein